LLLKSFAAEKFIKVPVSQRDMTIVVVSGGFDPVHIGHIRMMNEAKALGDKLVVVVNNDNWLMAKKGFVFMPENERKEVIEALRAVDEVVLTTHPPDPEDMTVCDALRELKPDIFAQGGDRKDGDGSTPPEEYTVCEELGIKLVFNVGHGGKVQSSSDLAKRLREHNKESVFKRFTLFFLLDHVGNSERS
jgi:cytidyltransferase-like protein